MNTEVRTWPQELICMRPAVLDVQSIAAGIYERTCRTTFNAPGFCVVNLGQSVDSTALRQLMVDLKRSMAAIHATRTGKTLVYFSAKRFDQQESTRPHLDGGPEESLLMLGYEPSDVDSELEISDYALCAFDLGLTPGEFMARHNPMFQSESALLRPYCTRIPGFSRNDFQIACINNSCAPFSQDHPQWQGTLHTATILTPDASKHRVLNHTIIASAPTGTPDAITESQQQEFITTSAVVRSE